MGDCRGFNQYMYELIEFIKTKRPPTERSPMIGDGRGVPYPCVRQRHPV